MTYQGTACNPLQPPIMAETSELIRAAACILWRLVCAEQGMERMRRALRRCQPYAPAHLYTSLTDSGSLRLYGRAWVRLLRLHGVRADELDGRLLAARVSSRDDGVSLADFLRWTRPTGCGGSDTNNGKAALDTGLTCKRPEVLVAHMGLLEVETAADLAAAAAAARSGCKGQCVPCTLFGCIDLSKQGFVTEADLARTMAVLHQPSFSNVAAVFRRLDRHSRGTLSRADWAVEFHHTEVACQCTALASITRCPPALDSPLLHPEVLLKESEGTRLQHGLPSSPSSHEATNIVLHVPCSLGSLEEFSQRPLLGVPGSPPFSKCPFLKHAAGESLTDKAVSCSPVCGAPRRVSSTRCCPLNSPKCSSSRAAGTEVLPAGHRSSRSNGLKRIGRHNCSPRARSLCSLSGDLHGVSCLKTPLEFTPQHFCYSAEGSPPAFPSPSLSLRPPSTSRSVSGLADTVTPQSVAGLAPASSSLQSAQRTTVPAYTTKDICTCKRQGATHRVCKVGFPPKYNFFQATSPQPFQGDNESTVPASPSLSAQTYSALPSLKTGYSYPLANQTLPSTPNCGTPHPHSNNVKKPGAPLCRQCEEERQYTSEPCIPSPQLQQVTQRTCPSASTRYRAGPCFEASTLTAPGQTNGHPTAVEGTTATALDRSHGQLPGLAHSMQPTVQQLQHQYHHQLLQLLQNQLQQQLQQHLQQQLQTQVVQLQRHMQRPVNESTPQGHGKGPQVLLLPHLTQGRQQPPITFPRRAQQQHKAGRSHSGSTLQRRIQTTCGEPTRCTVSCISRARGFVRCRSGPLAQPQQSSRLLSSAILPLPAACVQRQQWLQSWTGDARVAREKELQVTIKELATRPDFSLVDVWRLFDPEGTGISEANSVRDGMSRLGIRCSTEEAECFIWYYCAPHLKGLTFPVFASLFAAGGEEQIPLLQCIEQDNPCSMPAAYLALSAKTRKLLASFLRLALDKKWGSRHTPRIEEHLARDGALKEPLKVTAS